LAAAPGARPAVVAVREPRTTAAEAARAIVLDHSHAVGPEAELLLMLAARADLVRKVIRPALEAGSLVIADRFDPRPRPTGGGAGLRLTWPPRTGSPPVDWCPT
jgi:dTMP kinase